MRANNLLKIFFPMLILCGCRMDAPIPAVENFELARYMGKWFEYARMPNWFEKDMTDVSVEYSIMPDGRVKVVNSGYRNGKLKSITGVAEYTGKDGSGELKVSFFRPFYSPYRIIKLPADYRYSVVVSGKNYLWILSREKTLTPEDRQEITVFLQKNGYDTGKLIIRESTVTGR